MFNEVRMAHKPAKHWILIVVIAVDSTLLSTLSTPIIVRWHDRNRIASSEIQDDCKQIQNTVETIHIHVCKHSIVCDFLVSKRQSSQLRTYTYCTMCVAAYMLKDITCITCNVLCCAHLHGTKEICYILTKYTWKIQFDPEMIHFLKQGLTEIILML